MQHSEKGGFELPAPVPQATRKTGVPKWLRYCLTIASFKSQCAQPDPLFPSSKNERLEDMYEYLSTKEFRKESIERHSKAVQIPTQSYDDMGAVGEDSRWDVMFDFQKYLKETFPKVHKHLNPEVVNTHGLLYTYEGSDKSLKPLLLMAHQDVVPVPNATIDAWTHPPFSGHYDGTFIWGRGASDCKNQLVAIMEAMELFVEAGFEPKRTIVLSFGFDEEISGGRGAKNLAAFLFKRYGKDGLAALVDEGSQFQKAWGSTFAPVGSGEKGYTDVHITVRMPGGHSSVPVAHTSIGVLSELITKIEAEQYPTYLTDDNPYYGQLKCGAAHSPDFPDKLKELLGSHKSRTCKAKPDHLALEAAKQGRRIQYLMQTSQAVDVIDGGVKTNALPERVSVTINHRINIGDKPETVWKRITALSKEVAEKHDLDLHAFDGVEEKPNSISLWASPGSLQVAPVTPTNLDKNTPFRVLAGSTRAVYGEEIIVSPGMTTGNTDTRYYWDLTKHIFRFGPGYDPEFDSGNLNNIHTVDEHVSVANHIGMVKWFTTFVRNMDAADLED
ncbi:hypothetical protein BDY17DRAFT_317165 [Neohortaea acidophila]|uniref:Peptidase M20 dimerisation domain-containing protein n=1 Tax=Neohortaea acidophila TaxID=245834 RepID=A0A6A6PQX9_9PEZI|nr:uncharacterized protein BDY17DRAFT_317165 [Neohortaea acidophila]KAF2482500.1 hypothetical protein BDY17DRAFT_317165 [Neohortaea acidophila]